MSWLIDHQSYLWSFGTVLFGAVITRLMRLRPRLIYSVNHASSLLFDNAVPDALGVEERKRNIVRTASIALSNSGLQAAKNVELTLNWRPQILSIVPARTYEEDTSAFDRHTLKFSSFAPGETVIVDMMSVNLPLPDITALRADDAVGKQVNMTPQRVWPTWVGWLTLVLLVLGASTAIYLSAGLLQVIGGQLR